MDVIREMFGVPASDRSELRRLADLLVHREEGSYDDPAGRYRGRGASCSSYSSTCSPGVARNLLDDLTSALAHADGRR